MPSSDTDRITYAVIGMAMDVHNQLGPGLEEICYHEALTARLRSAGMEHAFKPRVEIVHRAQTADIFEADLVVSNQVVVELKHLSGAIGARHFAQLHCYLKAWNVSTGLLLDFGKQSLIVRRRTLPATPPPTTTRATLCSELLRKGMPSEDGTLLAGSLERVLSAHGLGYLDTTYRGLMRADLRAEAIDVSETTRAEISCGSSLRRPSRLDCMVIKSRFLLRILALHSAIPAADEAVAASYLRHLRLGSAVTINFGKDHLDLDVRRRT